MVGDQRSGAVRRWDALPRLLTLAPPRVLILVGAAVAALGLVIVSRPLTSLVLLGLYVGTSAIVSGIVELVSARRSPRWWNRVVPVLWILLGLAVVIWLGRSLDLLPTALAVLLILGGLASIGDAIANGTLSQRVLAASWGGSQIAFGVLSLAWPDVSVLLLAIVFGLRTCVFGLGLIRRGVRGMRRREPVARGSIPVAPTRRTRTLAAWAAAGRWAVAVLLVGTAGAGWWLNDWLADGAPVVDAFYTPPDILPSSHGQLIRSDEYLGRTPAGGEVRRILYTTRDANGRRVTGSGMVIIPTAPATGARPVVLWNHGTTGVARGCAPSLQDGTATKWAIPALDEAMAKGWVVVAPDYSGQGAPGVFPYLIGRGEARSGLDAALAARQLEGLRLSRSVVVWGHSQGGHAALWTAQIAAEYAPDLRVLGTVALAPAADPLALAQEMTRGDSSALLSVLISWVLVPYSDTYADVNLTDYVAPGARSIVREMTQRCPSEPGVMVSVVAALGVSEDRPLYVGDLTGGALGKRLQQNAATGPFPTPVFIAWGSADEVIPPFLQRQLVDQLCAQGDRVRSATFSNYGHRTILEPGSRFLPTLIDWTDGLFSWRRVDVDDCLR